MTLGGSRNWRSLPIVNMFSNEVMYGSNIDGDTGANLELEDAYKSGLLVVAASGILTAIVWIAAKLSSTTH